MPRGAGHAWSAPDRLGVPPALRELLVHRTGIEVRRCSECGLQVARAAAYTTGEPRVLALLVGGAWIRSATVGPCPA